MSVFLREKGWQGQRAAIPANAQAMAALANEIERLEALVAALTPHSDALQGLIKAINDHGTSGEEFTNAYRVAVATLAC